MKIVVIGGTGLIFGMDRGPILETFAPDYGETNTVGFAEALLVQDGLEHVLIDANSYTGNDGSDYGFQVFHLDHNYTYLAH